MSGSYNRKTPSNSSQSKYQQMYQIKPQNNFPPQYIKIDTIYQFTKTDEVHLKYLKDRFLKGIQTSISKNYDWMYRDQRDFRYQIYQLISQIAKKKINQQQQQQKILNQRNYYVERVNLLQDLLITLFQEMKNLKFDQTFKILKSKKFEDYNSTLVSKINIYIKQLEKLQELKYKQSYQMLQKLNNYQSIIESLDSHKKLKKLAQSQKLNTFQEQTTQKLISLTTKLGEYEKLMKQSLSNKWPKIFVSMLKDNFDSESIAQLQKTSNQVQKNSQLDSTINTLKIFCLKRNKEAKFIQQLNKMTPCDYNSVCEAFKLIQQKNIDSDLKRKFQKIFLKQITIKYLEIQNQKQLSKGQSFVEQVFNKYIAQVKKKGYTTIYPNVRIQKQQLQLDEIQQKLIQIEQMLGSKQKQGSNKNFSIISKNKLSNEIQDSIDRILKYLKTQNKKLKPALSSTQRQNNLTNTLQISNVSCQHKNSLTDKKINISQTNLTQILSLKINIYQSLKILKQSAYYAEGKSPYNSYPVAYYNIAYKSFDQIIMKIFENIDRIQKIVTPFLAKQSRESRIRFGRTNQNKVSQNKFNHYQTSQFQQNLSQTEINESLISSLRQQLQAVKIYSKTNLQESSKLKVQLMNLQIISKRLQDQNIQLSKKQKQYKQFQEICKKQWQKKNTIIQKQKTTINQQKRQLIDLNISLQNIKNKSSQKQSVQIVNLKNEILSKKQQIQNLMKDLNNSEFLIQQKDNIISQKQSKIHELSQQNCKFSLKITQLQKEILENQQLLQITKQKLNEKQLQIDGLKKNKSNQQQKIDELQKKAKQIEIQSQKLTIQKKVPQFRSFNTNNRQKSSMKTTMLQKKINTSPLKNTQLKPIIEKYECDNKNLASNQLKTQKQDSQNQLIQRKLKNKLNLQLNLLTLSLLPEAKKQNKQIEVNTKQNILLKKNIEQLQTKIQQFTNQLNQKQSIIDKLNHQIQNLKNETLTLNQRVQSISKKNLQNQEQINQLYKSNESLRDKHFQSSKLESQFNTLKKQKQQIANILKQTTEQLQKYKNLPQQKSQPSFESDELKKLSQDFAVKCREIERLEKLVTELTSKTNHLQDEKTTFSKTLQSLKAQHTEAIKKLQNKNKALTTPDGNTTPGGNQKKQNDPQAQKKQQKQLKMQILTLQLDLQQKIQHYDQLNKKYKKQTTALKQQIQKLKSTTSGSQSAIDTLKLQITQKQSTLTSKQKEILNLNNKINELSGLIQKQKEDSNKFIEQMAELKKENESLEKQLSRFSDERNKFESQNNSLRDKLNYERNSHNQEFTKMKKEHALQIKNTKLEGARAVQEIRRQIKSIEYAQRVNSIADTSNQNTGKMRLEFDKMKKELQIEVKRCETKQQEINQLKEKISALTKQIGIKDKQIVNANGDIQFMKASMEKLEKNLVPMKGGINKMSTIIYDRFFQNQALRQQFYKKYELFDLIQQKTKKSIKSTSIIYRLDFLNKVNFHNYIDGKENIVVIVKTSKGSIFGGFSTAKVQKGYKDPIGTISFIFTFNTPNGEIEYFNVDQKKNVNPKSMQWDEYFFVFGNAEIRWRFGEKKIYSNFAINNAFYETKGKDVSALLNEGNSRDAEIDAFDIYQVEFEK